MSTNLDSQASTEIHGCELFIAVFSGHHVHAPIFHISPDAPLRTP